MGDRDRSLQVKRADYKAIIQVETVSSRNDRRACCCELNSSIIKLIGASICIAIAISTWVALAEKLQGLGEKYPKFYFLTFWVHSFYSVLYLIWKAWRIFPGSFSCNSTGDGKLDWSFRRTIIVSGGVSIVAFISAYTWYLSLPKTPIPANTAIYQSSAAFVFIISVPLLKERVTLTKVLCVLISIGGVTLVSFYSHSNCQSPIPRTNHNQSVNYTVIGNASPTPEHTLTHLNPHSVTCSPEKSTPLGYIFLVISVLTYALMETTYKRFATAKDDPAALCNGVRFVGYFGVHTLLWMWPPLIVLHYTKVEVFEWPTWEIFRLMVLNAALDVTFNGCLFVAIALSSPLFASVGTILAIPTSVIVDWIVQGYLLPWQAFIGIGLIVLGFGGFAFSEFYTAWKEQKHKKRAMREEKEKEKEKEHKLPLTSSVVSNSSHASSLLLLSDEHNRSWTSIIIKYLI